MVSINDFYCYNNFLIITYYHNKIHIFIIYNTSLKLASQVTTITMTKVNCFYRGKVIYPLLEVFLLIFIYCSVIYQVRTSPNNPFNNIFIQIIEIFCTTYKEYSVANFYFLNENLLYNLKLLSE